MIISKNIDEIRKIINEQKLHKKRIGFIPTMGALHDGHLSLVDISKQHADFHVMSIFVNRIQFNDKSDFEAYPVETMSDIKKAEQSGIDLVFIPDENEMYNNQLTAIEVIKLTDMLCGAFRPGHFKGVFTVVAKFFNIIQPDLAVFGQKDIQQARCIEKMVYDLNFPVKIIFAPIIRDIDGLALSSRNVRLSEKERERALSIIKSIKMADSIIKTGVTNSTEIKHAVASIVNNEGKPENVDYISIVDYETLQETNIIDRKSVLAIAAFFGKTRLIDNMIIIPGKPVTCIY
ncbi:MAG: pantoate--beta-alanine ligase [Spirochaetes bacterium]|nr:pantoate--beta-alanine ligase [Spirochaetota bacterium]